MGACALCAWTFDLAYVTDDASGQTVVYCGGCHAPIVIEDLAA